jgi:hypothetical protein
LLDSRLRTAITPSGRIKKQKKSNSAGLMRRYASQEIRRG